MATARKIQLTTSDSGVFSSGIREDSAQVASELLQEDLEKHHVYFNNMGFHNHLVHHILSIFVLGATPEEIRDAYNRNKGYQRPALPADKAVIQSLYDKEGFKKCLGRDRNYPNFLEFFQQEIEKKGVENVLNEYLFSGDENAESMLARLFGGLIHPLIHLGFGIEFNQPAIIAEALAQTAIHEDWTGPMFLWPAEKLAGGIGKPGKKSLFQILEDIRGNEKLTGSAKWEDGNKLRDGVLRRAPDEMLRYAAEFTVSSDQMEAKLAEMINTVVYYSSAAQHPPKQVKFDFFLIHSLNSSIFFSKILSLPFLHTQTRLRLIEWKGRLDLLLYVSRGAPVLLLNEVTTYPASKSWETIFKHCNTHPGDDGHLAKLARAVAHGEAACRAFESQATERGLMITGDMWLKIGNMVMDSTSDQGPLWVRSTGFEQAWAEFQERRHRL
ncbi:hypA-like protein [Aspergillus steynii IBT 23096]|uniref:HypA-like protein n=1 Tax=Aspergillus steynii IBT 23096 TaxID=1392250 RepID=A0A2I2GGA0_9EURO|nr:hypA-like protein [Aspergillus steynii IBT 23096]PLB51911.1 hypA-like protein [Aspergillus steynii IBT 23096]